MVRVVAVLNGVGVLALVAGAVTLQVIPIAPLYFYPTSLPMSTPKRIPSLPLWSIFVLILVVSALFTLAVWDRFAVRRGAVLRLLVMLVGATASASVICSGFHLLLGTPRPDSRAQCTSSNVTFAQCSEVLSRADAIRQFQSFPASEAALLVSAAVMLSVVSRLLVAHSSAIAFVLTFLPAGAAVLGGAFLVATGAYSLMDVVGGGVTGFLCAYVGANSVLFAVKKAPLSTALQGNTRTMYASIINTRP
jgi:hypothetical protein